jgi:hypothetical protein
LAVTPGLGLRNTMSERVCANGPDFICIGMAKAGTAWLYDQLQFHPDFWMPPVKELHYLNMASPTLKNARRRYRNSQSRGSRTPPRRRPGDDRDTQFLKEASSLGGQPRNLDKYAALFRFKNEALSGDISPGYITLSDEAVTEVASRFPASKIVLLVRDPVARMWSAASMAHREGRFDAALLDDPADFRAFLEASRAIRERSFPSRVVERWNCCAPQVEFRAFLFDEIEHRPDEARKEILLFLGADPRKPSGILSAGHNRKAAAKKLTLTEPIQTVLVEYFRDELSACVGLFGDPAREWMTRYGL